MVPAAGQDVQEEGQATGLSRARLPATLRHLGRTESCTSVSSSGGRERRGWRISVTSSLGAAIAGAPK